MPLMPSRCPAQAPEALAGNVHDTFHLPSIMGSDHCPVGLSITLDGPQLQGSTKQAVAGVSMDAADADKDASS